MRNLVRALILAVFANAAAAVAQPALPPEIQIYKSPTCGCCSKWADHLTAAGFRVRVQDVTDLEPYKTKGGVPSSLQACHTAFVGGYVIEGHVPADVVKRLLEEKPQIAGLVVPGMPIGSPGMEQGSRKDHYAVLALQKDGKTTVYENR